MTTTRAVPRPRGTAVHSRFEHTVTIYDEHGAEIASRTTGDRTDLDDRLAGATRIGRWTPTEVGHVAVVELA